VDLLLKRVRAAAEGKPDRWALLQAEQRCTCCCAARVAYRLYGAQYLTSVPVLVLSLGQRSGMFTRLALPSGVPRTSWTDCSARRDSLPMVAVALTQLLLTAVAYMTGVGPLTTQQQQPMA
jgi:hypothetical protein